MTFADAVNSYAQIKLTEFKSEKHRRQWRSSLDRFAIATLGDIPVAAIDTSDILRALEQHWRERTASAKKVCGRIEAVLRWATVAGTGKATLRRDGAATSPKSCPARTRSPRRPPPGAGAVRCFSMVAATGKSRRSSRRGPAFRRPDRRPQRRGSQGHMGGNRFGRRDLDHSGRPHEIRSAAPCAAAPSGRLSPSGVPANAGQQTSVLRPPGWPTIGYSTFRQWTAERGYDRDMAELALAHVVGSEVERTYQRSDMLERRRDLLADWALFLQGKDPADQSGVARVRLAKCPTLTQPTP